MRNALVVGINTYQYLPELNAPANDAEAIASSLQTKGEFRVQRLPEVIQAGQPKIGQKTAVTLRELETALVNLFKPKGRNVPQTAVFYFSGHGIQKDAGIQEGYLATSDTNPEAGFYGLSLFWLRRLLQESPVRQRVIWLDCCHSGELLNFLEADPGAHPGTDRLFMAASREYEAAYESLNSPYSVFTQALVAGLEPQRVASGIVTNHVLTAWVSEALNGELQQPLFENSGSEIVLTRYTGSFLPTTVIQEERVCPYRGLEFFDENHAEYFFGREDLTDHLIEQLRTGRFIALVGASGSGKSSLIRAGLISELRRGQKFSGSDRWKIKLITPTEHPLKSLAAAFIDPDLNELERAEQLRRAEVFLKDGGTGLAQLVRASLPTRVGTTSLSLRERPHLLLVIDQFEEVFSLCCGAQAEQERQRFFDCLTGAIAAAGNCLSVVVGLRADFFGKCSLYETLAHQIEKHLVMVTPLSYEQIKATIVRPAQKVGLVCEPNLIYTMLLDLIGAPGELPLLQYTLLELWQRRQTDPTTGVASLTLNTYTELGGVRGTLQKRATEIFYSLTLEEQAIAKRIFLALTQLGEGTEDTRRRILKSELVSSVFSSEVIDRALEKLVAAKLVVTNNALPPHTVFSADDFAGHETIDVAHEALIRNWSLLRNWLDENREMLRRQRRIEQQAQEWDSAGQPLSTEYLLRGGRLIDTEDFIHQYPYELSALAQQYVAISQEESQRARRESRLLQVAVPSVLIVALMVTFNQYWSAVRTQTEKDYQLQVATSRERAAIAQSILQEPNGDPMTALLISRLAAERGGATYEAQSSLRSALQHLRLQVELAGHTAAVNQVAFSADRQHLVTASADGTLRIWNLEAHTVYTANREPIHTLAWSAAEASANVIALAISPDGTKVAAIAQNSPYVKVWSLETGELLFQTEVISPVALTHLLWSQDGRWIITGNQEGAIALWSAESATLATQLSAASAVEQLQLSPDGKRLLVVSNRTVKVWQLHQRQRTLTLEAIAFLPSTMTVSNATFSPKGHWIATTGEDGQVHLWESATGQLRQTFLPMQAETAQVNADRANDSAATSPEGLPSMRVVFSPNEEFLAISRRSRVSLWHLPSQKLWAELAPDPPTEMVMPEAAQIAFSPDSQTVVTNRRQSTLQDESYVVSLWNVSTGKAIGTLQRPQTSIESVQFSLDGSYIATAGNDGIIRLWSAYQGGELPTLTLPPAVVEWASFIHPFHQNAHLEARNSASQPLFSAPFWQVGGFALEKEQPSHAVTSAAIANLVTITPDGKLEHWQIAAHEQATIAAEPTRNLVSPGDRLPPPSFGQWFRNWVSSLTQILTRSRSDASPGSSIPSPEQAPSRLASLQLVQRSTPPSNADSLVGAALSADGQFIAIATRSNLEIRQQQPDRTFQVLHRLPNLPSEASVRSGSSATVTIRQLAFNADSSLLLGVADDFTVKLWDVRSGQLLYTLTGHQSTIQQARFSPDGQLLVTASLDRTARIWQVATGTLVKVIPHPEGVNSVSVSPDGQRLVTAGWDGTARIADVQTGTLRVVLTGHWEAVLSAEFSPDGRSIVTASEDGTARLWDAQTGTEQAQLRPIAIENEPLLIRRAFFSPDGQYIATLTDKGEVQLWAGTWETLLKLAQTRTLRQLTPQECIRYLRLAPNACPQLSLGG